MRSIAYDNLLRVWLEKVEIPLKQFLQNHTIAVEKILSLEEEIEETKMELQHLMHEMWKQIQKVADADARDLLTKRYLEFKPWKVVASELDYSVQHIYYLHNKALEKLRVHQSS